MSRDEHEVKVEELSLFAKTDCENANCSNFSDNVSYTGIDTKRYHEHSSNSVIQTETKTFMQQNTYFSNADCINKLTFSSKSFKFKECNFALVQDSVLRFCSRQRHILFPFIWGILVGVTLTTVLFQQGLLYSSPGSWNFDKGNLLYFGPQQGAIGPVKKISTSASRQMTAIDKDNKDTKDLLDEHSTDTTQQDFKDTKPRLFVGVITAGKFLGSRAVAVNNTWGSQVDGIEFFSQFGSKEEYNVPVVNLEHASDSEYPPQRKAFEMLKHMCVHHIDDYEWFIRADDDVYIRVDRLKQFLTTIDNDRKIYMGQPGHGVPEVRDRLGLRGHNFCMGGPGVLFNRKALKALCPHLDDCMKEVVSKEEDVEIGRCVTNHIHIECTHAWETLKLFYHSYQEEYEEEKPFLGNLAENDHVSGALTLHHLKVPYIMYRVHRHYSSLQLNETAQKILDLRRTLERVNSGLPLGQKFKMTTEKPIPSPFKPKRLSESTSWKSFSTDSVHSLSPVHVTTDITNDVLADLKQIGETGIDEAIGQSQGQKFTYSHVSDGYLKSDYQRGTDYLLDVYFNSKQPDTANEHRRVHLLRPIGNPKLCGSRHSYLQSGEAGFYIVVATTSLEGNHLESFIRGFFEPVFLTGNMTSFVHLVVVAIDNDESFLPNHVSPPTAQEVVAWYSDKYPNANMSFLPNSREEFPAKISSYDEAYARGIMYVHKLMEDRGLSPIQEPVLLLTSMNVSFTPAAIETCFLRTRPTSNTVVEPNQVADHRVSHTTSHIKPHIYQPIPFSIYPDSDFRSELLIFPENPKVDFKIVSTSDIKPDYGFWNIGTVTEEENEVVAPLCGRISDLYNPAKAALESNGKDPSLTFQRSLYDRIYEGILMLNRFPDSDFVNVPSS